MSSAIRGAALRRMLRPRNLGKTAAAAVGLGVAWTVFINTDDAQHRWKTPEDGALKPENLLKEWTPPTRKQVIDMLKSTMPEKGATTKPQAFDVLIVGGGATGAGCALDAATRGLKVAMVERDDYASGASEFI